MKFALTALIALLGTAASASPCFNAGTYKGKGFGWDPSGNVYPYEVVTTLSDANQGSSSYTWQGGQAAFSFKANGTNLLVDGQEAGASIQCGLSTTQLTMPTYTLNEEWTFVGNYLIRRGSKMKNNVKIVYQELLIRE